MESTYNTKHHNPIIRNTGNSDINNVLLKILTHTIYTCRLRHGTQDELNERSRFFLDFPATLNTN